MLLLNDLFDTCFKILGNHEAVNALAHLFVRKPLLLLNLTSYFDHDIVIAVARI